MYEALFNVINAWSLMAIPVMLSDGRSQKVGNKPAWFAGIMFLTNVFFIPFMALRAAPEPEEAPPPAAVAPDAPRPVRPPPPLPPSNQPLPAWSPVIGATSLAVGLLSCAWALAARPEYGMIGERLAYFQSMFSNDRCVLIMQTWHELAPHMSLPLTHTGSSSLLSSMVDCIASGR